MSPLVIALLLLTMVATSFLSGIFGMAGGMILIGVLLALLPLPAAMVLHAVTQMASNGWRALLWWRYIRWRPAVAYVGGCIVVLSLWSLVRYVPDKPVALLLLGVTPFLARMSPKSFQPDPESKLQCAAYGVICQTLLLMTGVSGPLLDTFFLGGGKMDRREIVATIVSSNSVMTRGLMSASVFLVILFARARKLSYQGLSISFFKGRACAGFPSSTASGLLRRRRAPAVLPARRTNCM